jgi:hypothetical protein
MLLFTMHLTLKIRIGIVSKCSVKMGVYTRETTFSLQGEKGGERERERERERE